MGCPRRVRRPSPGRLGRRAGQFLRCLCERAAAGLRPGAAFPSRRGAFPSGWGQGTGAGADGCGLRPAARRARPAAALGRASPARPGAGPPGMVDRAPCAGRSWHARQRAGRPGGRPWREGRRGDRSRRADGLAELGRTDRHSFRASWRRGGDRDRVQRGRRVLARAVGDAVGRARERLHMGRHRGRGDDTADPDGHDSHSERRHGALLRLGRAPPHSAGLCRRRGPPWRRDASVHRGTCERGVDDRDRGRHAGMARRDNDSPLHSRNPDNGRVDHGAPAHSLERDVHHTGGLRLDAVHAPARHRDEPDRCFAVERLHDQHSDSRHRLPERADIVDNREFHRLLRHAAADRDVAHPVAGKLERWDERDHPGHISRADTARGGGLRDIPGDGDEQLQRGDHGDHAG